MARKLGKNNRYLAYLVTGERAPCAFCLREVDDEVTYGKLYAIGDIQCHYFCCLLSCCLIQKGNDEEGLFGFMYTDILAEVERCKKHKCSYCGHSGANLGCSVATCRKQFHVPCGRNKNAVSLYYGAYKSFCQQHAPKQKIPDHIMANARLRTKAGRNKGRHVSMNMKIEPDGDMTEEMLCLICYEPVDGFPSVNTFWPPCCGKDAWFHRTCLQRMALSAGMHYLKCPLCNDKESFYDAVVEQGYYVPDRDAAWELEQNAFAEIYERPACCSAENCVCPLGRSHDAENGQWDIKLCLLCGSTGAHAQCIDQSVPPKPASLDQSETGKTKKRLSIENGVNSLDAVSMQQSLENLNISQSEPNKFSGEPNISKSTPNTLSDEPNISKSEPNAFSGEPNISKSKPNTLSDEPNISKSEPNTFSDEPNLFQNEPNKFSGEPNISKSEPNAFSGATNISKSEQNSDKSFTTLRFVCKSCLPAAPEDLDALANSIEAIIQEEQAQSTTEARRPVMTGRMSIRRTKGRRAISDRPSTSRPSVKVEANNGSPESLNTASSRLELNLKPPRRLQTEDSIVRGHTENKMMSPIKLLEQSFKEKMVCTGVRDAVLDEDVVNVLRRKFRKPRPMCERRRIIDNILDGIFDDLIKNPKQKEQVRDWCSPKKSTFEDSKGLQFDAIDIKEEIEESQNKENDSNTINNSSNIPKSIIEETISNLIDKDENINNNAVGYENGDDSYKINYECHNESKIEVTPIENKRETHNVSKNAENTQIKDVPKNNNEESDKIKIYYNSESNIKNDIQNCNVNGQNKIKNVSSDSENGQHKSKNIKTKKIDEKSRKTRNSIKLLAIDKDKDATNNNSDSNEVKSEIKEASTKTSDKIDQKQISEIAGNLENKDQNKSTADINKEKSNIVKPNKNKFSKKRFLLKVNHGKERKSLGGIEKSKYFPTKNNSFQDKYIGTKSTSHKDKHNIRSKSESSTDIKILKRLLTEKELCSQLLRELTTGNTDKNEKNNSSISDIQKIVYDHNNSKGTPKSVINSNSKQDNLKHDNTSERKNKVKSSKKTSSRSGETPQNSKPTSRCSERPEISEKSQSSKNMRESRLRSSSSKDSNKFKDTNEKRSRGSLKPSYRIPKLRGPLKSSDQNKLTSPNSDKSSLNIPKHKTIDIKQDSSLEISENDQHINIDVIKIEDSPTTEDSYKNLKVKLPEHLKTCFKFSPKEDTLHKTDVDIDLESFKNEYLSEVDREFKCNFRHKHVGKGSNDKRKYRSTIDFAIDAAMKKSEEYDTPKKRKIFEGGTKLVFNDGYSKRRKTSEGDLKLFYDCDKNNPENSKDKDTIESNEGKKKSDREKCKRKTKERRERRKMKKNKRSSRDKNIEVTIDSSEKRNKKKEKIKTKFAIQNENIQVKIKWKKKQLSLNIESKKKAKKEMKIKDDDSKFKQYVLQFSEGKSKEILVKPEKEVCPLKRAYVRKEKSPEKLKQMSIQSFFKIKTEK